MSQHLIFGTDVSKFSPYIQNFRFHVNSGSLKTIHIYRSSEAFPGCTEWNVWTASNIFNICGSEHHAL